MKHASQRDNLPDVLDLPDRGDHKDGDSVFRIVAVISLGLLGRLPLRARLVPRLVRLPVYRYRNPERFGIR